MKDPHFTQMGPARDLMSAIARSRKLSYGPGTAFPIGVDLFTVNRRICPTVLSVALAILATAQDSSTVVILKDSAVCHGNSSDTVGCITPPRQTHAPKPKYPKSERKARHEGAVRLTVVVDSDGDPHDIAVSQSLSPDLDQAALDAVRRWKFSPATKGGKPMPVQIAIEVQFHLTR